MTTTQYDLQRMGLLEQIQKWEPLAKQWKILQVADSQVAAAKKQLADLDAKEQDLQAAALEQRINSITYVVVKPASDVLGGNALGGPVTVEFTEHGRIYTKALHSLENHERQALIRGYWNDIPASIRLLGNTPEEALNTYGDGRRRGYLRG